MDNKMIALKTTMFVFRDKEEEDDDFAVQLFIENTVFPKDVESYTMSELEKRILEFLENRE